MEEIRWQKAGGSGYVEETGLETAFPPPTPHQASWHFTPVTVQGQELLALPSDSRLQ